MTFCSTICCFLKRNGYSDNEMQSKSIPIVIKVFIGEIMVCERTSLQKAHSKMATFVRKVKLMVRLVSMQHINSIESSV